MEFSDLSDTIEADDWLIASQEISARRLIKRTPNYNIYKADWFGDVLLYEPRGEDARSKRKSNVESELKCERRLGCDLLDRDDLDGTRLMKLNLNLSQPMNSARHLEEYQDGLRSPDSAYSSISSTPEYHTKGNGRSEFEFPVMSSPCQKQIAEKSNETRPSKDETEPSTAMLLNRSSFGLGEQHKQSGSCWFELNELRLIAHEGFMLFMGASIEHLQEEQRTTSLVIQTNHPNTISLHDLLHRHTRGFSQPGSLGCAPERLLRSPRAKLARQLTNQAKLNICQQVTNAMTYLHDKEIVHGRLSSVNIYIELNQRVKISLIDHDENALASRLPGDSNNSVTFNLPALTYLAPELIQTIKLTCANNKQICDPGHLSAPLSLDKSELLPIEIDARKLTKSSDIFSFGTLLFELFEERYPFSSPRSSSSSTVSSPILSKQQQSSWNGNINNSAAELIYQIGSGQMVDKNLTWLSGPVSHIIAACWTQNPCIRPHFKQITFV